MTSCSLKYDVQKRIIRQIRVAWYSEKIRNVVVPQLEKVMGLSINNCKVLVCGTGGGEDLEVLAGLGADAVGVDIDKSNAPFWKGRQLNCILADGRYLPFKKHSFDCVIAIEVIEHIGQEKKGMLRKAERKRFVDELKRVCRRQGAIFLSTPNQKFPIDIAHVGMSRSIVGGLSIGGIRFHTPWESFTLSLQDLKKLFEEMPIELISFELCKLELGIFYET
jgi:2-polyprenyl-3-methyl-5-hydroxy-6-metoxy-1,4-benzoquinol methylase